MPTIIKSEFIIEKNLLKYTSSVIKLSSQPIKILAQKNWKKFLMKTAQASDVIYKLLAKFIFCGSFDEK
jgi:hypothetical protein